MKIDFGKLDSSGRGKPLEPRDIFMRFPKKDNRYSYPRDVQTEVWTEWYKIRDQRDIILKMNTGSGKTTVALTILQSCLNENTGPAIYIVPDNYLVSQVCAEASRLGVRTTLEPDYYYTESKAIYVTNIHKLVNGQSVFGMKRQNTYDIGSIVIDDVHACMNTIRQQYAVRISSNEDAYEKIVKILNEPLKNYSEQAHYDIITQKDRSHSLLVPFWIWQDKCREVLTALKQKDFTEKEFVKFNLPLIVDVFQLCNCVISADGIEISPKAPMMAKILSFNGAKRRIFMSATVSDDSLFVSEIGVDEKCLSNIITPNKANDIGDRLILFPQYLNLEISDEAIRVKLKELSKNYNVVVLAPSFERASFWTDFGAKQVSSENMKESIRQIKENVPGFYVLVNKYDGVDLPDDSCRILVVDGLPEIQSMYENEVQKINPDDKRICRERIQKIEQGMGRGVRSNNDYCAIIFMGKKLHDAIVNRRGVEFFSNSTLAQYKLSQEVWSQLMEPGNAPSIEEIFGLIDYVTGREEGWTEASKNILSTIEYDKSPKIDRVSLALREAYDFSIEGNYELAEKTLQDCIKKCEDSETDGTKGYLMSVMAEYVNLFDQSRAQEIIISAKKLNKRIVNPIKGTGFGKETQKYLGQAQNLLNYYKNNFNKPNDYVILVNRLLGNLCFGNTKADIFEESLMAISSCIGIGSSRPDKETSTGPDNLLRLNEKEYLVVECKNESTANTISKQYCDQLGGSMRWFKDRYIDSRATPIMVHPSTIFDWHSAPDPNTRIITEKNLDSLKRQIMAFAAEVVKKDNMHNINALSCILKSHSLTNKDLVSAFTSNYSLEKNK